MVCFIIASLFKKWDPIPLSILLYSLLCFFFLLNYFEIPNSSRKYFQTAYTTFEYLFFTYILFKNIKNRKIKPYIVILSFLFIVFQAIYVQLGTIIKLDTIPIGIETILIVFYIIVFLSELAKNMETSIFRNYCFWISIGILIYLCGSFFFYILIDSLSREEVLAFGKMTYIVEIIKNVLFGISLIIFSKAGFKKEVQEEIRPAPYLDIT